MWVSYNHDYLHKRFCYSSDLPVVAIRTEDLVLNPQGIVDRLVQYGLRKKREREECDLSPTTERFHKSVAAGHKYAEQHAEVVTLMRETPSFHGVCAYFGLS